MSARPPTALETDMFADRTCRNCFQTDEATRRVLGKGFGCPILRRAATGRLPRQWRRRRNAPLGETFQCEDFTDKPPSSKRRHAPAVTLEMFDIEPAEVHLVPVDGWPDYRAQQSLDKHGDHQ